MHLQGLYKSSLSINDERADDLHLSGLVESRVGSKMSLKSPHITNAVFLQGPSLFPKLFVKFSLDGINVH